MKNLIRISLFQALSFLLILGCTKDIDLRTEVEFSVTEQHRAKGYVEEGIATTVTVIPEEVLEEFSYFWSYEVSEGEGRFEDVDGNILEAGEAMPLEPYSISAMYMGAKAGQHTVKVTASDNYGFTEEIELEYTLEEVPPVIWTATSPIKRMELGNSATITVSFEKSELALDVEYERSYSIDVGSGRLTETEEEVEIAWDTYEAVAPGIYTFTFTPDELGMAELSFNLKGDDGEQYVAELSFEVLTEIIDEVDPVIKLEGDPFVVIEVGTTYVDAGATAADDVDGDITANIIIDTSNVDTTTAGTYTVTFNVSDSSNNPADEKRRTVEVVAGENPQSNQNDIIAFGIPGQEGTAAIASMNKIITVNVPFGTELNVAPTVLTVSEGAMVSPAITDPRNFENPVVYNVTSESGAVAEWTVNVVVAASNEKSIEMFSINGVEVSPSNNDIELTLPAGTDASSLQPEISFIGSSLSPASGETVDFTDPVVYTVTAEDGSTQDYTVTVVIELSETNDIIEFVVNNVQGNINGTDISLNLPEGTDEKSLSPVIEHNGESINPASGTTRDFSNPVPYTVTAESSAQQTYLVSVVVANDTPQAAMGPVPGEVAIDQVINFSGSASSDDIAIVSYSWDFGDGSIGSSTPNPTHSYSVHGTYTVSLTVTDDGGLTDTITTTIDVPNVGPTAVATAAPTTVGTGQNINFTGSGSTDDAGIISYEWTFGDGSSSNLADPVHSYASSGTKTATLTVSDGEYSNTIVISVNVNDPPTARDDSVSVSSGGTVSIDVLDNDTDPDGDNLTITSFTNPSNGTVERSGSNLSYKADANCSNTSFTYTIDDGNGNQDTATVTISKRTSASFSNGTSVSSSFPTTSGTVTVTCGSVKFSVSVYGGSSGSGASLTINGITESVSAPANQNMSKEFTMAMPPGTYSYTLGGGSGGSGAAGSASWSAE